jgi:hypothetical protein
MRTILALVCTVLIISAAATRAQGPAERAVDTATDVAKGAVDTGKNVAHSVAKGTKKAAYKVKDALTPDPDANRVDVTATADKIEMPDSIPSGKTAFVVTNRADEKLTFKVEGKDESFSRTLAPNETKVFHVNLDAGSYHTTTKVIGKNTNTVKVSLKVK